MAYTVAANDTAKHAFALVAATVETVTLTKFTGRVEIVSDGTAAVYYTTDNTAPTVAGANTYVLPGGVVSIDTRGLASVNGDGVLKLISAGTPTLSVQKTN